MKKLTLKKILILPLILLIPVSILVLVMSLFNFSSDARLLASSVANHFSEATTQFSEGIKKIDDQVYLNIENSRNYLSLSLNDRGFEDPAYYTASAELLDVMASLVSIEPSLKSIFLKFDNCDELWQRGYITSDLKDRVTSLAPEDSYPRVFIEDSESASSIGFVRRSSSGLIGYQLDVRPYMDIIRDDVIAPEKIFFCHSGTVPDGLDDYRILSAPVHELNIDVYCCYKPDTLFGGLSVYTIIVFILALICFTVTPLIMFFYYRQIVVPTNALNTGINTIKQGDIDYRIAIPNTSADSEFTDTIQYFNEMLDQVQQAKIDVYELQLAQKELKLDYYSQQIRPHFILNVLNTIYTYKPEQWEYAKQLILNLVDYFRYIVNIKKDFVPLCQELDFIKKYLEIQKQRLDNSFISLVTWEHALDDVLIPPLIISSFVENCIKHGLTNPSSNCVAVTATGSGDRFVIRICDSGQGFSKEIIDAVEEYRRSRTLSDKLGKGLVNTIDRLNLYYENNYSLTFKNDGGATIELILPKDINTDVHTIDR